MSFFCRYFITPPGCALARRLKKVKDSPDKLAHPLQVHSQSVPTPNCAPAFSSADFLPSTSRENDFNCDINSNDSVQLGYTFNRTKTNNGRKRRASLSEDRLAENSSSDDSDLVEIIGVKRSSRLDDELSQNEYTRISDRALETRNSVFASSMPKTVTGSSFTATQEPR